MSAHRRMVVRRIEVMVLCDEGSASASAEDVRRVVHDNLSTARAVHVTAQASDTLTGENEKAAALDEARADKRVVARYLGAPQ